MKWRAFLVAVFLGTLLISCSTTSPVTEATPDPVQQHAGTTRSGQTLAKDGTVVARVQNLEIPAGTVLRVRIDDSLSTERNRAGDPFTGTLVGPAQMNGKDVLPNGTRFKGHVTTSGDSGRMKGRAVIGITLDSFQQAGSEHRVTTSLDVVRSDSHKKRNIELIGGGAGLGALIGGIAGGGKGAAIGAGAGAGAGTAGAYATGKKHVVIPAETVFSFTVKEPVPLKQ
jgi:hypothetical protein